MVKDEEEPAVLKKSMLQLSGKKLGKLTLADVEQWKEFKNQSGAFHASIGRQKDDEAEKLPSGNLPSLSTRAGYVKINLNSTLDVPLCPNTTVFTVIKGKGKIRDKNEINPKLGKFEMVAGDIFTFPQGCGFIISNTGTKTDLILSYVKL